MKVWNPSSKSFEATPPLPEFVGHWQTHEGRQEKEASSLTRLALLVTYVGTKEEGEPLFACAIGTVPA